MSSIEDIRNELNDSLEESFQAFLNQENVPDNSLLRVAFYTAALQAARAEPDSDPEFQEIALELLESLLTTHATTLANLIEPNQ